MMVCNVVPIDNIPEKIYNLSKYFMNIVTDMNEIIATIGLRRVLIVLYMYQAHIQFNVYCNYKVVFKAFGRTSSIYYVFKST